MRDNAIENIGNNVVIEFEDMDFTSQGLRSIRLRGRSHTDKNTINILFTNEAGQTKQVIEFPHSSSYVEHEFDLEPLVGKYKVSFVFLPGSNFDFSWFQFK